MVTLAEIETAVRAQRGSWQTMFRRHGGGWHCILYPRHLLTNDEYQHLARRLNAPDGGAALTPAARKRNSIRALADKADRHAR